MREGVVVAAIAVAAVLMARSEPTGPSTGVVYQVLTLVAAAIGTAAAILADLAGRLRDEPRRAWSGAALATYSLVIVPSTAVELAEPAREPELRAVRLVAYITVLILLLMATRRSRCGGAWTGWAVAVLGTACAMFLGHVMGGASDHVSAFLERSVSCVALLGWGCAAVVYLQRALRSSSLPLLRVGLGVGVLTAAQVYRQAFGITSAIPDLGFAAFRLVGLVAVTVGFAGLWVQAHGSARDDREHQAEELRVATAHLHQAAAAGARRDHELRNAIGALAGITALLTVSEDDGEPLRAAVLAELGRLSRLIDSEQADDPAAADVARVLRETAALHGARGLEVSATADRDVQAEVPEAVLRQVLTNVVINAERHAAGSPVELTACRDGSLVVIEARDHGPGVEPGQEEGVFEDGSRSAKTGGEGLGLNICRELLTMHGA